MTLRVLALDLERTLIDDALSGRPRPGLHAFLTFCLEQFERVALFTCVEEADAREVLEALARSGHVPEDCLQRLEFVAWHGDHKDLRFIAGVRPDEVLLLDDDAGWVHPDQRTRWLAVAGWFGDEDTELERLQRMLADLARRRG